MKLGIWEHKEHPIWEYGKTEKMKLGTGNMVILKFELGNLHPPLGSPHSLVVWWIVHSCIREHILQNHSGLEMVDQACVGMEVRMNNYDEVKVYYVLLLLITCMHQCSDNGIL